MIKDHIGESEGSSWQIEWSKRSGDPRKKKKAPVEKSRGITS